MKEIIRGWDLGKKAKQFFGVDWNQLWFVPLEEVRAQLGVPLDLAR